ncbi:hypothetical protein LSCM4_04784 [Leishmania orientalis]|uniref:DNA-directed DNA polymerase n=1 Tax=Leishmania orientalis TaxID=2249476 RepID=A0A836KLB5_9TRYP|nr:hypothetical protein LSCM4_04784 [Leishmania orientalis]
MYMQVLSIEHSLERPQAELGDEALSPIFHRVSARCPVLHLFGYVHIPSDLVPAKTGTAAPAASAESHRASSSVPENKAGCYNKIMSAATPDPPLRGSSGGGILRLSRSTGLASRRGGASAMAQRDGASPSPRKAMNVLDDHEHHNKAGLDGAVAQRRGTPSSFLSPSCTPHGASDAISDEGHSSICTAAGLCSSTARRDCYTQRRACLHVHGVYPSLQLPQYDRNVSAAQLAAQLETVVLRVLARQGTFVPSQQLVHSVRVVRRFSLYGYRRHAYAFYEVKLIDPDLLPMVADVLQNSTEVGGRRWQLYDAHYRYHSQFMVRWRVNGAAPFLLPPGQCHVRLPTVAELWQNASSLPASLGTMGRLQEPRHSRAVRSDTAKQPLKDEDEEEHHQVSARSVQQSQPLFRRLWRPDELDRLTTAEVELDVASADLLGDSSAIEEEETKVAGVVRSRRSIVGAGDNLSYTRRVIRHYFGEHGVADALRVADTIAMERHQQDCVHAVAGVFQGVISSTKDAAPAAVTAKTNEPLPPRRYGNVMQIQNGDPTVRWLRHRMLGYLAERTVTNAAVAAALVAPLATRAEGGSKAPASIRLSRTSAAPPFLSASRAGSAAQLQEQRAIRAQLVAEYRQPGGGTAMRSPHGSRRGGTGALRTHSYADGYIAVPPPFAHAPDSGPAVVGGDALYVGFSSESLQLSVSQRHTQQSHPEAAAASESAAVQPSPSSSSYLSLYDEFSPTARAAVVVAPTQDLLKALAPPHTLSSRPRGKVPTTSDASAATTTPRRSVVSIDEAGESDRGGLQSAQEMARELASHADAALTDAAEAAPTAATLALAGSSCSSWSSASASSSASLSRGRASPDHDSSRSANSEGVDPRNARSSAAEPPERAQEEPCPEASDAVAVVSDAPTQRLLRSCGWRSPRMSEAQRGDVASDAPSSTDAEAIRPSVGVSQEERSLLLLESCDSYAAAGEVANAEDDSTPRGQSRCAAICAAASPTTKPSNRLTPCRTLAKGDCIAFVRVRDVASSRRLGEVLAVARVASLTAETAELQWLLRLSETHLAGEEQGLVRRGSWLRSQQTLAAAASTAPSMGSFGQQSAAAAHDVLLGEMVLGNVRDSVPASALEGDARADLTYATVQSTPTQHLLADEDAGPALLALDRGAMGVTARQAEPEERCASQVVERRRPSGDVTAVVQVWRARCFTDVAAYHSGAGAPHTRHRTHAGHLSRCSPPLLRVLCRYAYHVEARVLTPVSPDAFTPGSPACAGDGRPLSSSRSVSSFTGKHLESGERTANAAAARRSSHARASSTRALFTQPQPLLPSSSTPVHLKAAAASLKSASVPCSALTQLPVTFSSAARREASEDGGEEALLFPSSSASTGSSGGSGSKGAPKRRLEAACAWVVGPALPRLAPMREGASPQSPSETSDTPSPSAAVATSPQHAVDPSPPVVGRLWRVVLARMPPPEFSVQSIRVVRRVQAVGRMAAHAFMLQTQARRRRRGSSGTTDDSDGNRIDAAEAGVVEERGASPVLLFSNASADAGGDGDEGQPFDAKPRDGSAAEDAHSGGTAVGAEGRGATEVVIASAASSLARSSSAAPLTSFMAPSRTPTQSTSSSADAVREVTASQRDFLDLLQASRHLGEGDARMVLLQRGGQLGCIADGMTRCFTVSTSPRSGGSGGGSGDMRVSVSAVAWPWPATTGVAPNDEAAAPHRYESVPSLPAPPASVAGASSGVRVAPTAAHAPRDPGAKHDPLSMVGRRKSASHVPGLSLSSTRQPQHYLQCTLRVLYIEVLLHRRAGEALAATSEVLAVGLGQATSATNSAIAVRVFCVAAPSHRSGAGAAPPLSATSSAGGPQPFLGLTEAVQVVTVSDEAALLARVRGEILAYDPDLLISWDGFRYGLGYLALRYRAVLQRNLASDLSRVLQHHDYQRPNADGVSHFAAAATALGGDAGGASDMAEHGCLSVAEDVPADMRRGCAEADRLAAARYRSPPPASPAGVPLMVGSGSSGDGGKALPAQESVQGATDMAARSSASSGAGSSAAFAAPMNDLDEGDDAVDDGNMNDLGVKGCVRGRRSGASAGQTTEHRCGHMIHWAHTGSRWNAQSPLMVRPHAEVDQGAATSASRLPASGAVATCPYVNRFGANVEVAGRICVSLGKDLLKEVKMPSYSLPMAHVQLLGQPLPYFTDSYLAELFLAPQCTDASGGGERHTALRYLAARVVAPHRIACRLHWFTKLLEFSRMYGILAKEVLTRGSQFRVEATLLRLAQPLGYAMLSPSLRQVHRQPRIECVPLVMQPKSDLYRHDPVVVLDFRSLYPSIILAYNLCYSTCLGMVQPQSHGRLGVLPRFKQSDATLTELLADDGVVFAPNGAMFVTPNTRVGLLPQMMQAVLDARYEVQAALKHIAVPSEDVAMQQRLQEQQLALKMLANVTYGYSAASYTGRMPCVDLAEAIVSLGRQTLERAIALIHSTPAWQAEVVYGDTDSLFVRLAGRTRADAFRIGQEMADAVTQSNPAPIRLQLEKVLLPCLLLVKKRYAGYMWSSPTQLTPTFLAKGIETVRRDQCPATAQLAERLLRLLFDGASTTALRRSYYAAVERLQSGTANPIQCIFRRAVKLGRYKDSGDAHLPLAARLAFQQVEKDATQTPYWGERLPYVVVRSTTAVDKLADKVLHPEQLLQVRDTHSLDAAYYIARHLNNTLDRIFYLVGISFTQWYQAMPRRRTAHSALLNLPTFMAAQQRQQHLQSRVPPGVGGTASHLFPLDSASAALSPRSRQARFGKLTSLMKELHHHGSSGLLSSPCGGGASAAANAAAEAEEVSDSDVESGEAGQSTGMEALTRLSIQEVIDVDQIATQRSRRPSSSLADAMPPLLDGFLKPGQAGSRSGRRQRWRNVTLDSFYPRTLCVICDEGAVSLDDIGRQQAVLMHVGVAGCRASVGGRPCPSSLFSSTATAPAAPLPAPLLLPPICTRCWSDPLPLLHHVQQQCRSIGRQMDALQGLCARCISSGGDAGDAAAGAYKRAIADMEDMDAFRMSSTLTRRSNFPGPMHDGVDGSTPRHVLAAVELSGEGVLRGCVSVDCAVGFEKKWVTAQQAHWEALRAFLNRVL